MGKKRLYEELASRVDAVHNCIDRTNTIWEDRHRDFIIYIEDTFLPQGSGFDSGTTVLVDEIRNREYLHLHTAYHVMDDNGMYDGWIDVDVVVKPSLTHGFLLRATGKFGSKHQDLKFYIEEVFEQVLNVEIDVEEQYSKSVKQQNRQETMAK